MKQEKKFTIREVSPKIFVISFNSQYELCMTFVRIQEFYESPKFKGKYFCLEEFMDWWAEKYGKGVFTYTKVWNGFNIPGETLKEWMALFIRKENIYLRLRERQLIEGIRKCCNVKSREDIPDDIYIIGVDRSDGSIKRRECQSHEIAHALFHRNHRYRIKCLSLLSRLKSTKRGMMVYGQAENILKHRGYCDDVIDDEMQAFFSTSIIDDGSLLMARNDFKKNYLKSVKSKKIEKVLKRG